MVIAQIAYQVKEGWVETFITATLENARNTRQEPGNRRFDVYQQEDDPTQFILSEVFDSPEALEAHRQTDHYKKWKDIMADGVVSRTATRYIPVHPSTEDWVHG